MDINAVCENSSQAEVLSEIEGIAQIYSYKCPSTIKNRWVQLLPYIFRDEEKVMLDMEASGVLIRNYEELEFVREKGFGGNLIADAGLYSFNSYSRERLRKDGIKKDTVPLELQYNELRDRGAEGSEIIIYGRVPMMISANCLYLTQNRKCGKNIKRGHLMELTDRKKTDFPVFADCRYCYNIIYNSVPLSLHKDIDKIISLKPASLRLEFTTESPEETKEKAEFFINLVNKNIRAEYNGAYTRGHFRKGVD